MMPAGYRKSCGTGADVINLHRYRPCFPWLKGLHNATNSTTASFPATECVHPSQHGCILIIDREANAAIYPLQILYPIEASRIANSANNSRLSAADNYHVFHPYIAQTHPVFHAPCPPSRIQCRNEWDVELFCGNIFGYGVTA